MTANNFMEPTSEAEKALAALLDIIAKYAVNFEHTDQKQIQLIRLEQAMRLAK